MGCGCKKFINVYLESEITARVLDRKPQILLPTIKSDYDDLKCQIINEFLQILQQLECGKHPDIEIILEEISLIEADKYGEL